jgi:hypothetical protein
MANRDVIDVSGIGTRLLRPNPALQPRFRAMTFCPNSGRPRPVGCSRLGGDDGVATMVNPHGVGGQRTRSNMGSMVEAAKASGGADRRDGGGREKY